MTDLTIHMTKAVEDLALKWVEYIMDGTNVEPLATSTVYSKVRKGSTYPDIPLVDTGKMLDSIGSRVEMLGENEVLGTVEGTDDKWIWHEYGLGVPERPTLRPVVDTNIDAILETMADGIFEDIKQEFIKGD
jgi:hypothetical protein